MRVRTDIVTYLFFKVRNEWPKYLLFVDIYFYYLYCNVYQFTYNLILIF